MINQQFTCRYSVDGPLALYNVHCNYYSACDKQLHVKPGPNVQGHYRAGCQRGTQREIFEQKDRFSAQQFDLRHRGHMGPATALGMIDRRSS